MPIQILSVTEDRATWPTLTNKQSLPAITKAQTLGTNVLTSHKTGMTPVAQFSFTGEEQTQTDENPQGVCEYNGLVLTSHGFKYGSLQLCTKLLVNDVANLQAARVAILEYDSGVFMRIESGAGGMAVIGDYLYVVDSPTKSIRVFDLREVYAKSDNLAVLDEIDSFFLEYDYFLPQVGQIFCSTPSDCNMGYMSYSNGELVIGNFYFPNSSYSAGGQSMVWRVPVVSGVQEFPSPQPNATVTEILPLFPTGANVGETITKIQGAAITDTEVLVLSRSYGSGVYQLVVMDLLNPQGYYLGNTTDPTTHDWKNWKYGCENLSFSADGTSLWTVTEFQTDRDVTAWSVSDIVGLMGVYLDPTIAEHQAALALMQIQLADLQTAVNFYSLQITTAISENLARFNANTYLVE